jgi:hypothetical protein
MSAIRVLYENLRTQLDDVFGRMQIDDARIALGEPAAQSIFGTADHRRNFPERIVEVQSDRTYTEHVLPTVLQ